MTRSLKITARFPLGVYLGHKPDGSADTLPDPARLHAALLNSAAQGTHAVQGEQGLEPSETSLKALMWLEENQPDGIEIPEYMPVYKDARRFMHREVAQAKKKRQTEKRTISEGTAVSGKIGWVWNQVPNDIADTVEQLCDDVPHLGESTSVAVLAPGDVNPNLNLDLQGSPLESGGTMLRVPAIGRTNALLEMYRNNNSRKFPTVASDKPKEEEKPENLPVTHECLTQVMYSTPEPEYPEVPWSRVGLLEIEGEELPPEEHVALCVALHRAIIAGIGYGASSFFTGKYPRGAEVPANRLAFHYIPAHYIQHLGIKNSVIAIMVPENTSPEDLIQLGRSLNAVPYLWGRTFGKRKVYFGGQVINAHEFWPAVHAGYKRLWKPLTAIVPETRPVKKKDGGARWTLADSGLLSIAYVWRDKFNTFARGEQRYLELRNQVKEQSDAQVYQARTIHTRPTVYVHKVPQNVMPQPWQGVLSLGNLANDRTIIALGQSRHLGAGLLVPYDVPEEEFIYLQQAYKERKNDQ